MTPKERLQVVQMEVKRCVECELHQTRHRTVFFRGSPDADLMFVGEAPGANEDLAGCPFIGDAGQLLDKMIEAMGLSPATEVYICNAIKCRPPDNRAPDPEEIEACNPFLRAQIKLVRPKVIVALGKTATKALGLPLPKKWRGQWGFCDVDAIPIMSTYHPSYLLRSPEKKKAVGKDMVSVLKKMGLR